MNAILQELANLQIDLPVETVKSIVAKKVAALKTTDGARGGIPKSTNTNINNNANNNSNVDIIELINVIINELANIDVEGGKKIKAVGSKGASKSKRSTNTNINNNTNSNSNVDIVELINQLISLLINANVDIAGGKSKLAKTKLSSA